MNEERELIHEFLHQGKFDAVSKAASILFPNNKTIVVTETYVDGVRLINNKNEINILCPSNISENAIMENALVEAITNGDIYDDAEKVKDHAEFLRMTALPNVAMAHADVDEPKTLTTAIMPVISKMDDSGHFPITNAGLTNGINCIKDMTATEKPAEEVRRVMDNYIADHDLEKENDGSPVDIVKLSKDIDNIKSVSPEDTISREDYDEVEYEDEPTEEGCCTQEGFLVKKPKKLKPIKRDIIPYITDQMRNIQTQNDQALIASYVSNKLEFVDFYITVIDTSDDRFIVPHTRDYLVSMQNDLNRLLTQILNVKPVNKFDRVWKMTLPEGYL